MTIFSDECVYQVTIDFLRNWGFSVITTQEAGLAGYKNGDVLAYAQNNGHPSFTSLHFSVK